MSSYTNPFGGGVIKPADVSFRNLAIAAALTQLSWPGYAVDDSEQSANKIDITASVVSAVVRMPPANVVSVGESIIFTNLAADTVEIQTYNGNVIGTIATGASRLVYLTANADTDGIWRTILYGVGTGTLDVASAAGYGLEASGVTLQLAFKPVTAQAASFSVGAAQRATTQVWTGGSGIMTLGSAVTLGAGFIFALRNQGTGALLSATAGVQTIDGELPGGVLLGLGESCFVVSDGANWYTIGRAPTTQFNFTLLTKAIAAGTTVLTATEAANVMQEYTGALASNAIVEFPAVVQVYYVTNSTTGGFSTLFRVSSAGAGVSLTAGESAVLLCDGVDVINASTLLVGGATSGTYVPTLTAVANIGGLSVPASWFWTRVGNVVRVSGLLNGTPTAATTATQIGISLPVASAFSAAGNCAGSGKQVTNANGEAVGVYADTTNDRAEAFFQSLTNVASAYVVEFSYIIQ